MAAVTPARFLASGFGAGFSPVAPGTVGSLVGLAIGAALLSSAPILLPFAGLAACLTGFWAIRASRAEDDPGWVVMDEIAGQLIAILPLAHPNPLGLLTGFALFRLFDIAKPGPVGWLDRRHDALGVMGDDIVAGAAAAVLLWLLGRAIPSLVA